nr:hypothetical protein [uncultured Dongia sp.]
MLSRRQTLTMLGLGTVSTGLMLGAGGLWLDYRRRWETPALAQTLFALLPDPDGAAALGALWLARHPELVASPRALPDHLAARLAGHGWVAAGDGLAAMVVAIVRDEFRRGQVEDVQGWRLSEFQAALCGLAYHMTSLPRMG